MCFNGTKNFEKNSLIDYLQSVGVTMGPDINGYTSFGQTGYILTLPVDSANILENGFQIMEDWAHNVSFEEEEIDGLLNRFWDKREGYHPAATWKPALGEHGSQCHRCGKKVNMCRL